MDAEKSMKPILAYFLQGVLIGLTCCPNEELEGDEEEGEEKEEEEESVDVR